MPKLESRVLGMELAGFDPLKLFTPEQVEKMRSMEPEFKQPTKWENICVPGEIKKEFLEDFKKYNFEHKSEFFKIIYKLGIKTYEKLARD